MATRFARVVARAAAIVPVVACVLAVPGTAHAVAHTWAHHDGTAETSMRFDEQGADWLTSGFDLPEGSVSSATSATLWIYARADGCGPGTSGAQRIYKSNGSQIAEFDPCTRWPTTTFGWASFAVPLSLLYEKPSSWNRFRIADLEGERHAHYALDTDTDLGITDAYARDGGTTVTYPGEAMWELTMNGNTPALAVTPGADDFGMVDPGITSAARSFTVTNTGTANVNAMSGITVSGPHAGDYAVTADTCTGAALPVGASCSFAVAFTPTGIGVRSATVTVASGGASRAVALTGSGRSLPPVSVITTPDGAVLAPWDSVTGVVTDDLAMAYEYVTFVPEAPLLASVTVRATLGCDAAQTVCDWYVRTMLVQPGRYTVVASGVDQQGIAESPGPRRSVLVV